MLARLTESAFNGPFPEYLDKIYEEEALTDHDSGKFIAPEHLFKMSTCARLW